MNFYEAQDDALRRTKLLVFYFILAVIGVVLAVYAVLGALMAYNGQSFWDAGLFLKVSLGTTVVILLGSTFKGLQLSAGGEVVARDMGGRPVDPHTTDVEERKLMNVVEEMAIASGLPVPQVWVMDDEPGINAFAAGTEPGNAVIGVTRGCIQRLTRSELQGVIAHEFSHILNGDMKLNMRLIGWLYGIMMLSIIGRIMFEAWRFAGTTRRSSNGKDNGAAVVIAIMLAGIALIIIGSIGVFFGRMIQAAISRQREFLADASAVQFTREPEGIAGALKKIGGQEYGSGLHSSKAGEASHMFFADGGMFSYGMATHPPLDVRIKAIEAHWNGEFEQSELPPVASHQYSRDERVSGFSGSVTAPEMRVERKDWDQIGDPSTTNIATGSMILNSLQPTWVEACRDREQAQALVFGLLLAVDEKLKLGELEYLNKSAGRTACELAQRWQVELGDEHSSQKIALVDLSIPTLRRLTKPEYERFIGITKWMIASDGQVDIFEFMLQKVLERHLDAHYAPKGAPKIRYTRHAQLSNEINVLISTMAGIGARGSGDVQLAHESASQALQERGGVALQLLPPDQCGLRLVDTALEKLEQATPTIKRDVLHASGVAVMHDGVLGSREAELLRAAADAIGCSIPPFVKA
ncbi:protease HtpX [Rubritalea halochordaticola]|uniref:Protease HtpX n=1 Tax=Rubritalea halochordaticola TaxID=714537 RepID=A0ABP9V2D3_9BACT